MILDNPRKILKAEENDKILIHLSTQERKSTVVFKTVFSESRDAIVKMQVIATNDNLNFPLEARYYYSLGGKNLVRLKYEDLYRIDMVIDSIYLLDKTDTIPLYKQLVGPLFIIRQNEEFTIGKDFKTELIGFFKSIGAIYDPLHSTFCFLEPKSDIYRYLEEGITNETESSNSSDEADIPSVS